MPELRKTAHGQVRDWEEAPGAMKRAYGDARLAELEFPCHRCGTVARWRQVRVPLPTLDDQTEVFHTYCSAHCELAGCSSEWCQHPREGEDEAPDV